MRGRSRTPRPALAAQSNPGGAQGLSQAGARAELSFPRAGGGGVERPHLSALQRILDLQQRIEDHPLSPHRGAQKVTDLGAGGRGALAPAPPPPPPPEVHGSRSDKKRELRARMAELEKKLDIFQVKALTDSFLREAHARRPR